MRALSGIKQSRSKLCLKWLAARINQNHEAYKSPESLFPSLNYSQKWHRALALLTGDVLENCLAPRYQSPRCLAHLISISDQAVLAQITQTTLEGDQVIYRSSSWPLCTTIHQDLSKPSNQRRGFSKQHARNALETKRQAQHGPTFQKSPKQSCNVELHSWLQYIGQ